MDAQTHAERTALPHQPYEQDVAPEADAAPVPLPGAMLQRLTTAGARERARVLLPIQRTIGNYALARQLAPTSTVLQRDPPPGGATATWTGIELEEATALMRSNGAFSHAGTWDMYIANFWQAIGRDGVEAPPYGFRVPGRDPSLFIRNGRPAGRSELPEGVLTRAELRALVRAQYGEPPAVPPTNAPAQPAQQPPRPPLWQQRPPQQPQAPEPEPPQVVVRPRPGEIVDPLGRTDPALPAPAAARGVIPPTGPGVEPGGGLAPLEAPLLVRIGRGLGRGARAAGRFVRGAGRAIGGLVRRGLGLMAVVGHVSDAEGLARAQREPGRWFRTPDGRWMSVDEIPVGTEVTVIREGLEVTGTVVQGEGGHHRVELPPSRLSPT